MSRGTCRECKREITMRGNGLCHRCYNAAKRAEVNPTPALPLSGEGAASAGFVPDLEMVNKAMRRGSSATIPPDKGGSRGVEIMPDVRVILPMQHLLVSFVERDAELFKRLEERAFAARRSPEQQILYVLDHYLSIMQNQEDSQWKAA